jgi:dTDP-4-dehydrorhamnose reductase
MRAILLTGKNGQIGWELQRTLQPLGKVIAVGSEQLDLNEPDMIRRVVREISPDIIVNAAAYTDVDKAESEPGLAHAINGVAPGILAEEAKRLDAWLVHYSTDYVFDGKKSDAYLETDEPNPLNVYGRTKLAGEHAITEIGGKHLILRTSWIYGARGRNFLLTMLCLAKERSELRIVNDQIGAPTWSRMIAEMTSQILAQLHAPGGGVGEGLSGIYHLTAQGAVSWYDFAQAIFELAAVEQKPSLVSISSAEYPVAACRPSNSRLDNGYLHRVFGLNAGDWDKSLELCCEELNPIWL